MADDGANAKEVFRRSTMNRIASADELDHYIKVTNPSAWVVAIAALLLVAGVIVWAVVAIVPVTVSTTGVLLKGSQEAAPVVICVVDKSTAEKIEASGAKTTVGDVEAESTVVNNVPASAAEIVDLLDSEFIVDSLKLDDWNYMVSITLNEEPNHSDYMIGTSVGEAYLVPVSIVVSETRPINIVLGNE